MQKTIFCFLQKKSTWKKSRLRRSFSNPCLSILLLLVFHIDISCLAKPQSSNFSILESDSSDDKRLQRVYELCRGKRFSEANVYLASWYEKLKNPLHSLDSPRHKRIKAEYESARAWILHCQGRNTNALEKVTEAIVIDPTCATAFNVLGSVRFSEGEIGLAQEAFAKALELDPQRKCAGCGGTILLQANPKSNPETGNRND